MVRQKPRKTVENLYTGTPPPESLAATTLFNENLFQNSKNGKMKEKTDNCTNSTVNCSKKSKARYSVEKKDQKTLINEEKIQGRSKKKEELTTKNHFNEEHEKDEDTEEFFGMIKETVEKAVEKSLQDIIGRSLREISVKLDEIQERVINNENTFDKIQAELINKIVHYGEENSRHFRYLCMKSEYDKMFYQHQNAIHLDPRPSPVNPYPQQSTPPSEPIAQPIHQTKPIRLPTNFSSKSNKSSTLPTICNCPKNGFTDFDCAQQSKLSVSSKSSDMGIREVKELLEQLQKFYDQHNQEKDDQKGELGNEPLDVPDQDDSADGDEDDESSDDMNSPSIEENIGAGGDS